MPDPRNKRYATWSKARRFEAAVKKVLDDGWTQTEAALEYGVTRSTLNPKCREEKLKREQAASLVSDPTPGLKPLGVEERKRLPETFQEFDDYYWGHWQCPDCEKHHEREPFHDEIMDVFTNPEIHRAVVNVPPFHAKSTYATVKGTIFRLSHNLNTRQVIISKSQPFSETFLSSIDQLLTNHDLYQPGRDLIDDVGGFKPDAAQSIWNRRSIYVAGRTTAEKDPTVQVLGIGNQIYGRRADDITLDDIADTESSRNPDRVAKDLEWLQKMVHNRVGKRGKVMYVGTRVNHGDVYSHLRLLPGWTVVAYPCVLDEEEELVLWPDHFPFSQAMLFKSEMTEADFQLIYQNVDIPGAGSSFPVEIIEECKDHSRVLGHFEPSWRLIGGLDPAGGNKKSGYTAMMVRGVDLKTGMRYLVDAVAVKSMKAPQLRDKMFELTDRYPIYEWRVESNGVQSQLVQYNDEIRQHLAQRGVRVVPHFTHGNKWDSEFGVESMAPLFQTNQVSVPWGNAEAQRTFQPYIDQLVAFPMASLSDMVMADWFAELGIRDIVTRGHLPLFNSRMRVPRRIRQRRHVVDFYDGEVKGVPEHDQRHGHLWNPRSARQVIGRPQKWGNVEEYEGAEPVRMVNVPKFIQPGMPVSTR